MEDRSICTGREFKEMFAAGALWLEKSVPEINSINVFPVPDGDTGTNMHLTLRSTLEEAERASSNKVSDISKSMAQGALMGARGNSGVILSQFFRGLAKGLDKKDTITTVDWARALNEAAHTAYKGLSQPTEGTMLTVMRDVASAAENAAQKYSDDFINVMQVIVDSARDSVARTPQLLPILRDAGVVDAGGQGFYVILEGALLYLRGEIESKKFSKPELVTVADLRRNVDYKSSQIEKEEPYGYCTNFLLVGQKLNPDKIRAKLEGKGQSIVVAGDSNNVRVHIHTYDPGAVLRFATSLGTLHHIQIQNMDDQHEEFIEMQQTKVVTSHVNDIAVIAVALGEGMAEVFKSLGAVDIIPGGQTMNPSVKEILETIERVNSKQIILLPNNKNVILSASQVKELTEKKVEVLPTKTMPQGICALLAFNYEGTLEDNIELMTDAISQVKTLEVTKSIRTTKINDIDIHEGDYIGIIDDKDIIYSGTNLNEVVLESLNLAGIKKYEIITLYYGRDVDDNEARTIMDKIKDKYPDKQIEIVSGKQPHYHYIISLE